MRGAVLVEIVKVAARTWLGARGVLVPSIKVAARTWLGARRVLASTLVMAAVCAQAQWPLPGIPSALTAPQDRADYLALHFWSAGHETDIDPGDLEQAFVDFLSVLPYTSDTRTQTEAVDSLVAQTADIGREIAVLAEKYLYETESPMLNEDLYERFLLCRLGREDVGEAEKARIRLAMDEIARDKPGSMAEDIEVRIDSSCHDTRSTGSEEPQSLMQLAEGVTAIVLFYDHDCESCQQTIAEMMADTRLASDLQEGTVKVIAVDVDLVTDRSEKRQLAGWYWTTALSDVEDRYSIRSYPSIYVLAPGGEILIKDSPYRKVKW